jgi:hypothetical protein
MARLIQRHQGMLAMAKPTIIIVGADKGGVGKTTLTRCVMEYLRAHGVAVRPFDTQADSPKGSLRRFHSDATIVDFTDSDGQMKVLDSLAGVTVIDLAAGGLSPALKLFGEVGLIAAGKVDVIVMHVLGSTVASIDEIKSIASAIAGVQYVAVGNRIGATKFEFPPEAIDIPALDSRACEAVDAASQSFFDFVNAGASMVLAQKVRHWLGLVAAQFDKTPLAAVR